MNTKHYRTKTGLPTLAQFMRRKRGLHVSGQTPAHSSKPREIRVFVPDDIRADAFNLQDYRVTACLSGPVLQFEPRSQRQIAAKVESPWMNINTI